MSQKHRDKATEDKPSFPRQLTPEQVILIISLFCFLVFLWLVAFLIFSVAPNRSPSVVQRLLLIPATTPEFVLPATWTPTPVGTPAPLTPTATGVHDGSEPTRIYTPRATSAPLGSLPFPFLPPRLTVVDLARIMQGESPGDLQAAYRVGWVAKNRLLHPSYGDTYAVVSYGFFGYRADLEPSKEFLAMARRVIRSTEDPTGGCLYALSRTDITKLNVPASRADVAYGEWFFFRTWPLSGR